MKWVKFGVSMVGCAAVSCVLVARDDASVWLLAAATGWAFNAGVELMKVASASADRRPR
jgi:hypothetical protein